MSDAPDSPHHPPSQGNTTQDNDWIVETFAVGPLGCNCTILGDPTTGHAIVVDPGGDADKILAVVQHHGLTVQRIVHTHAHFDHFLASGQMREATGAPLGLHSADAPLWEALERQCAMFGIPYQPVPPPDDWLDHEEPLLVGTLEGECLHTPGHSPGSVCFHFEPLKLLLGGDTLFRRSIGRTDLWGGHADTLMQSIRDRLFVLDEATHVVTGHGPATSIGEELRENPYVGCQA